MNKKSAFVLAAAIIATPVVAAPSVQDCTLYTSPKTAKLPYYAPETGTFIAAQFVGQIDTVSKRICYKIGGEPLVGTSVTPGYLCANVDDPKEKDPQVTLRFADGTTQDISFLFTLRQSRANYVALQKECVDGAFPFKRDPLNPAKPAIDEGVSYRVLHAKQAQTPSL